MMKHGQRRPRYIVAVTATIVAMLLGACVSPGQDTSPTSDGGSSQRTTLPGPAYNTAGFDPGNVISDEIFFNVDAMTEDEVRAFIKRIGTGCVPAADGTPCLQDYRQDVTGFPADRHCTTTYGPATDQDAAAIIVHTAKSCGINPQILLLTLQKEQGLLTKTGQGLTPRGYKYAMGYACPDGSPCDGDFEGLAHQVWYAARQFKLYEARPGEYRYRPGNTYDIAYAPSEGCGSAPVTIANQATANLYNYTPYQPDPMTLEGWHGSCSNWGQANIYSLYNGWFRDKQ